MVYSTSSSNQSAGTKVNVNINTDSEAVPPTVNITIEIVNLAYIRLDQVLAQVRAHVMEETSRMI